MDKFWGKNIDYYRFKSKALLDIFEINSKREKIHSEELGKTPQEILKKSMGRSCRYSKSSLFWNSCIKNRFYKDRKKDFFWDYFRFKKFRTTLFEK